MRHFCSVASLTERPHSWRAVDLLQYNWEDGCGSAGDAIGPVEPLRQGPVKSHGHTIMFTVETCRNTLAEILVLAGCHSTGAGGVSQYYDANVSRNTVHP